MTDPTPAAELRAAAALLRKYPRLLWVKAEWPVLDGALLAHLLETEAECIAAVKDVKRIVPKLLDSVAGEPTDATMTVTIDTSSAALAFARAVTKAATP